MKPLLRAAHSSFAILAFGCATKPDVHQPDSAVVASNPSLLTADAESSAVAFARSFYRSYAPRGAASGLFAVDSIISERPAAFSRDLLQALKADAKTRSEAQGEIAGLDFDPFLGGQDCDKYEVGSPFASATAPANVLVPVFAVCSGKRDTVPVVIAEVAREKTDWAFANFRYPGVPGPDLLTTLKQR